MDKSVIVPEYSKITFSYDSKISSWVKLNNILFNHHIWLQFALLSIHERHNIVLTI